MTSRRYSPRAATTSSGVGFFALCAISGAAGLVYEVLWLRLFSLWLGHGTAAAGTVLAAFMGGLAGGAWLGGRVAERLPVPRALVAYGLLEACVAAYALVLPVAMGLVHPALGGPYANGEGGALFAVLRVLIALAFLAPPAMAMGATYPLAVRWFTGGVDHVAERGRFAHLTAARGSRVYAANTAGAAFGVALVGFVLLPMLGSDRAAWVGVGMSLTAAGLALWIARGATLEPRQATDRTMPRLATSPAHAPLATAAVVASGFVSLVYEVAWTRILTMVLGPTAYAFSGMLLASITGLAAGAALGSWLIPRVSRPGAWLGGSLVLAAFAALAASAVVDRLPLMMAAAAAAPDAGFVSMLRLQLAVGVAVQVPITTALGAAFTFALAHAAPERGGVARPAARIYAANTAGAIAGALAGSFVLIPWLGLQATVRLGVALTSVAGALVCLATATPRARLALSVAAATALAAAVLLPDWNREFLANGAYRYAPALAEGDIATGLEAGRLLFYREGAAGTVSVRQLPGVRSLAIDGKVDASNAEDMLTQKLLAHLPLLLHQDPRDVLVVGLGSGVTAGAALQHSVSRVDVVEISHDVVAASALFETENLGALADPRTRLIVGDGRSHLLLGDRDYDVIISEPSNPWMAGVAALFTREFFQAVRGRLADGGVFCQWAHTYNIAADDLRSIVATFLETFPSGSAWLVGDNDLLLVASAATATATALGDGVRRAWQRPGVAADLASVDVLDPYSLLTLFVAQGEDLRRYAGDAGVQADGALSLEYSAPRAIYGRFQESNLAALHAVAARAARPAAIARAEENVTLTERVHRGVMRLRADAAASAYDDFAAVARQRPDDAIALDGLVRAAARAGRLDDGIRLLREVARRSERAPTLVALSRVLALDRQLEEATNVARQAVLASSGDPASMQQLASMYAEVGDTAALEQIVRIVAGSPAHRQVALYCTARLSMLAGNWSQAAEAAGRLATARPGDVEAWTLLGTARAALAERASAREAFERALQIAPRTVAVLEALGSLELQAGNPDDAVERFSDALFLQPTRATALEGLARAHDANGDVHRAAAIRLVLTAAVAESQ